MTDRRETPDLTVAKSSSPREITAACVDLCASPNGPRDRQLLLGDALELLGTLQQHCYVRSQKDNYLGYVESNKIGISNGLTLQVVSAATHIYAKPSIKSSEIISLSFNSKINSIKACCPTIFAYQELYFATSSFIARMTYGILVLTSGTNYPIAIFYLLSVVFKYVYRDLIAHGEINQTLLNKKMYFSDMSKFKCKSVVFGGRVVTPENPYLTDDEITILEEEKKSLVIMDSIWVLCF